MPHPATQRALTAAACFALGFGLAHAQTMYKWVDEKGTTHFSESPPPDDPKSKTKATKVEPKVTPPSSPSAYKDNAEKWREQETDFKKRQIDKGQKESVDAQDKAKRSAECDRVRIRLANFQQRRIYKDNPDGTRTWVEDKERDAEIESMKDAIRQKCD